MSLPILITAVQQQLCAAYLAGENTKENGMQSLIEMLQEDNGGTPIIVPFITFLSHKKEVE